MIHDNHLEECRAAAALYSLMALPAEEAAQFELRLKSGCPVCTSQYGEYASVADELASATLTPTPPPALWDRLLERLDTSARPVSPPQSEMTLVRDADAPWLKSPAPGVEVKHLLGKRTMLV